MNYPKWKQLINDRPDYLDFALAWKVTFGADFEDCKVTNVFDEAFGSNTNVGFTVKTPTVIWHHAGFIDHTEEPVMKEGQEWDWKGGITWDIDANGNRFYYIEMQSMLPADWAKVHAINIIKNFLLNHQDRRKFLENGQS